MNVFDQYAKAAEEILAPYSLQKLSGHGVAWPAVEKNPFIMERDTAMELGGYPKQSVNLILSSSGFSFGNGGGIYLLGDPKALGTHCSFGKVILLKTREIPDDQVYPYLKSTEFLDLRLHLKNVMHRLSSEKFFMDLKVGKVAMRDGFSLEKMGRTIYWKYRELEEVQECKVILLVGDSPVYQKLVPIAEKVKQGTSALNTMLEGIEFNCKNCSLNKICAEVDGLKRMHAAARRAGTI